MLVIENNSVYEIDEECLKRKKVKKECELPEEIVKRVLDKKKKGDA